jgi:hypothetical protein
MNAVKAWMSSTMTGASTIGERTTLMLFTATIFLSATLLFAVQPMFAKMVLPTLGGSPSVWAVSMCFFQAVLLAGYCYAHALNRFLSPRAALIVHIAVLSVATLALPVALPDFAHEAPSGNAYFWLIGVLAAGVGVPFFAVSANAPLLQSWFARSGHPHASDPYFLYAASNIGSLLVLLAYPIVIEPALGVMAQGTVWSGGFVVLCAAIIASGLCVLGRGQAEADVSPTTIAQPVAAISWSQRASWIGLSFIPSALLVAFTTFLTTDIASAPFLWVLPLAFFLLTFVLVFRDVPVISHVWLVDRQPLAAALAIFGTASVKGSNWYIGLAGGVAAFFITSLVCHRELYLRRPAASNLTEFYLWMSFGGVLGGMFSALVAPQLFTSIFEFPLIVALGLLARPAVLAAVSTDKAELRRAVIMAAAGIAVLVAIDQAISHGLFAGHFKLRSGVIAVLIGAIIVFRNRILLEMSAFALMLAAAAILPEGSGSSHVVRSFFGVHRVVDTTDGTFRLLMHGTTTHGARRLLSKTGQPLSDVVPATYYYSQAPMVRSVDIARDHKVGEEGFRAGVVGLGAGAIACSAKANEAWRFYEIDQAVVDIARDPKQFGFLSHCQPRAEMIVGDARLTLANAAAGSFDYLLIDAFSSDAVPTHLMTAEAFRLYLSKLTPNGVLALHISNRHLDLAPVVAAGMATIPGYNAVLVVDVPNNPGNDTAPSRVVLVSRDEAVVISALKLSGAKRLEPTDGVHAWTDDYSDILSALVRGWTGKASSNREARAH